MYKPIKFYALLLVLSACCTDLQACTKPVFRYALERWRAAPYRLAVLHKGPIDDETREPLSELVPEGSYNLFIDYFDVDKELPEGPLRDSWLADPDPARLPLALLVPPVRVETDKPILWQGRIDSAGAQTLKQLLYGPVVQQLLERLASGDTAVWILAKGSDETKNRQTRSLLDKSLAALTQELKLPHEQDPEDSQYDSDLLPGIPMRMNFTVIEVDLDDPANRLLKASFPTVYSESLKQPGPKIIPVYGRCRGLDVIFGEDINDDVVQQISYFLVGPCSCRVKDLNPGFDLLAPFPWDAILYEETELSAAVKEFPKARAKRSETGGDSR